jgi:hypothetical protein
VQVITTGTSFVKLFIVVYYESIKRELKIKPIYECRCDERLQTKTKRFTPQHGIHAKHLLRYVWDRRHAKLTWCAGKVNPPFQTGQFHSFADSSWADVIPSRKSTNSYDIFCNNAVVSWKTKLSAIIITSSTEVELISAAYCAAEVAFIRKLAQELGFVQVSPTIIFEDNNGAIALGNSGHFKDWNSTETLASISAASACVVWRNYIFNLTVGLLVS